MGEEERDHERSPAQDEEWTRGNEVEREVGEHVEQT